MELYPGMKAHMGRWSYFVVKMTMREVAEGVKFASDVYDNRTLDEALQRVLDESRVKRDLVSYLQKQQDRFFNSLVVAAIGGAPKWYPVSIEDDPRFEVFRDDERLNETFGILSFDGSQSYYALDGQHRLSAIKALVSPQSDAHANKPEGFEREEVSVLIVVPDGAESDGDFRQRYRRLFGNLNRYAKPMDHATSIIMDEDDAFAITTRRLVSEHPFFKSGGGSADSHRVKTTKGKSLTKNDAYFTSLEALYSITEQLLSSNARTADGWDDEHSDSKRFKRFRPADDVIESLYDELALYWSGLVDVLPELSNEPVSMRNHSIVDSEEESSDRDSLLFWPIGQELLADVVRRMLDTRLEDPKNPTAESVKAALTPLSKIDWSLDSPPWRNFLLVPGQGGNSWTMRSEDRKEAITLAYNLILWSVGVNMLDDESVETLKSQWAYYLIPSMPEAESDAMWQAFMDAWGGSI